MNDDLRLLRLLHLADSALPIGTLSHSWGLETLAEEALITPEDIESVLEPFLDDQLFLDAVFCRAAYRAAGDRGELDNLNVLCSARKPMRESREASLALGRRFLQLIETCVEQNVAIDIGELHYCIAFGAIARHLSIDDDSSVLAFLEQSCAGLLSCAMRLLPIGQLFANAVLWRAKPRIAETAKRSRDVDVHNAPCFAPALEIAGMRHPLLETRLFVS